MPELQIIIDWTKWKITELSWFKKYTGRHPKTLKPEEIDEPEILAAYVFIGTHRLDPAFTIEMAEDLTVEQIGAVLEAIAAELAETSEIEADQEAAEGEETLNPTPASRRRKPTSEVSSPPSAISTG